jgi:hypothetical protein
LEKFEKFELVATSGVTRITVVQQESRTDYLVGDLVGKSISKIETDGNKQTRQYSKEIQPVTKASKAGGLVRLLVL